MNDIMRLKTTSHQVCRTLEMTRAKDVQEKYGGESLNGE